VQNKDSQTQFRLQNLKRRGQFGDRRVWESNVEIGLNEIDLEDVNYIEGPK
jgi:hypothetical protein